MECCALEHVESLVYCGKLKKTPTKLWFTVQVVLELAKCSTATQWLKSGHSRYQWCLQSWITNMSLWSVWLMMRAEAWIFLFLIKIKSNWQCILRCHCRKEKKEKERKGKANKGFLLQSTCNVNWSLYHPDAFTFCCESRCIIFFCNMMHLLLIDSKCHSL